MQYIVVQQRLVEPVQVQSTQLGAAMCDVGAVDAVGASRSVLCAPCSGADVGGASRADVGGARSSGIAQASC